MLDAAAVGGLQFRIVDITDFHLAGPQIDDASVPAHASSSLADSRSPSSRRGGFPGLSAPLRINPAVYATPRTGAAANRSCQDGEGDRKRCAIARRPPLDCPPQPVCFPFMAGFRTSNRPSGPPRHLPGKDQWLSSRLIVPLPLRGQRRHSTGFPIIHQRQSSHSSTMNGPNRSRRWEKSTRENDIAALAGDIVSFCVSPANSTRQPRMLHGVDYGSGRPSGGIAKARRLKAVPSAPKACH